MDKVMEHGMWVLPVALVLFWWLAVTVDQKRWRVGWRAVVVLGSWLTVWTAIRYVAQADKGDAPVTWAFRSLLRGISALSNVGFSAWFIPALLFTLLFRSELKTFVSRLVGSVKSMEAGGVKIELKEPETVSVALTAQWWADNPAASDHARDTPAGDGAMRVRPERPTTKYAEATVKIEEILSGVTTENQSTLGPLAKALETEWVGEYTEYLELSLNVLRQRLESKALVGVSEKYLATVFTLRHIMLYLNGDDDHAVQFMAHLKYLSKEHARGTLKHAMGYWFILFLCERKHFEIARRLATHELLDSEPATAAAYNALIRLKSARYDEAIETAARGLGLPSETVASRAVLEFVMAQAYVRCGNAKRSIHFSELVMNYAEQKPYGLLNYLRRNAVRAYAYACSQTKQIERLQAIVESHEYAGEDPYVRYALAVALVNDGLHELALDTMRQALVLLPPVGEDTLRKAIDSNLAKLGAA